jgi:predicted enzyme related to lactoylglutathione lyase
MSEHGTFYWNELMTPDPAAARAFYETAIGWTFDEMPMGDGATYLVAKVGDRPVGGIFNTSGTDMAGLPEHWFPYLSVDDIDARCANAKAAGGTIAREPFDVPGIGRIAMIQQPGGGMVGWMTPAPQQ